jgi:selenocysteine lyase/cysteine desulfurase
LFSALQAAPAGASAAPTDWSKVREGFPWLKNRLWLTAADYHPIGIHSLRAMESYMNYRAYGPGDGRSNFRQDAETKDLFGRLINAKPTEVAFVQSTTDAENLVISGMRFGETKGNIVITTSYITR